MSKYMQVKTEYRDKEVFLAAVADYCNEAGIDFEQGRDLPLYGYHGDKRSETADVVIRRQYIGSASNDLGFKFTENGGVTAIVSQFDRTSSNTTRIRSGIRQSYTRMHIVEHKAKEMGYEVADFERQADGSVRVRLRPSRRQSRRRQVRQTVGR